jgi:hypothetical protein
LIGEAAVSESDQHVWCNEHDPDPTDPESSVELTGEALAEDDVPFAEPDIHMEAD